MTPFSTRPIRLTDRTRVGYRGYFFGYFTAG